jgi:hypothetical protein
MKAWNWVALASIVAGCGADAGAEDKTNPELRLEEPELMGDKCEGPDGLRCPSGKFCATSANANRCPGFETKGICRAIPEVCIHIYRPACGCDGKTYGNDCQAAAAGVAIAYDGQCAPFCGGIAGLPCPGAGTCVDNTTDACDPSAGGFDCGSLCRCEVEETCSEGAHWDSSPDVCACVWDQ